ncbi:ETC complex I subunit [Rhodoblastus sp.]|uniref:ETC complex I subunit n=2 Tax=Rhodoblastus sp. TaxID=1962975 RepID=UPI0035B32384
MTARIYRPSKPATQSGMGKTKLWRLEYTPESARTIEPLMGWTSSGDMKSQIKLTFDTREEAVAYCERNGIAYRVEEPQELKRRIVSYSDNFRNNRLAPWTH